jgi:HNH endonuclease
MARLDGGPLVTGQTARRIAEDADVTPVLVDGRGGILHVGRRTRTVSPRKRRALNLRDGGCQGPGREVTPDLCTPHHLRHWADGGPSDLPNLRPYCTVHHGRQHPENDRFRKGAAVQPAAP